MKLFPMTVMAINEELGYGMVTLSLLFDILILPFSVIGAIVTYIYNKCN